MKKTSFSRKKNAPAVRSSCPNTIDIGGFMVICVLLVFASSWALLFLFFSVLVIFTCSNCASLGFIMISNVFGHSQKVAFLSFSIEWNGFGRIRVMCQNPCILKHIGDCVLYVPVVPSGFSCRPGLLLLLFVFRFFFGAALVSCRTPAPSRRTTGMGQQARAAQEAHENN